MPALPVAACFHDGKTSANIRTLLVGSKPLLSVVIPARKRTFQTEIQTTVIIIIILN